MMFTDPYPHLSDSTLWTSLFRKTSLLENRPAAKELHHRLYELRRFGGCIKRTHQGTKLAPLDGHMTQEEFDEIRVYLYPFQSEIQDLLRRL